jgi:putative transposase
MPWSETDAMKERVKLVLEWEKRWDENEGKVNMSELCREFGVSRECGYKWIARYRKANHDIRAVEERSRRPQDSPNAVTDEMQDFIAEARKVRPKWGPVKLRGWLVDAFPGNDFPSASTFAAILKRRGLIRPAKRRRRGGPVSGVSSPFPECDAPNAVWCVDFKGWFLTADGKRCYPLTILDAYSRYVFRCEGLLEPDGRAAMKAFDSVFQEFGLPTAIRSDNGPPFASTGAAGLTSLAVWLLQLGIRLERIAPGKPQQNGRHERMHRTLKLETDLATKPKANLRVQQRTFDYWRREYNEDRPHASLGNRPPARIYVPSSRKYPRKRISPEPAAWSHSAFVDKNGFIKLQRRKYFVSSALRHQYIELELIGPERWELRWGPILLGRIDWNRPDHRVIVARRKRGKVSTMSLE